MDVTGMEDPLEIGATTRATVTLRNEGKEEIRPRFSVSWLPYPYYWRIASGPEVLKPGATETYVIEAPESVAAPHDGVRFQVKVNDATSITYAISRALVRGDDRLPVVNPTLRMWTDRDPSSGKISPAGWHIYTRADGGDAAVVEPSTIDGVEAAHFHVEQDGKTDPGLWAHAGLRQDIPFPRSRLTVKVLSNVPYEAITDGWLVKAFGLEISRGDRQRIWLLFQHTGRGDLEYDLPNGQHIVVYDVPQGVWVDQSIDLPDLYRRLNWHTPKQVSLKLFIAASSFTEAEIDGYVAGIELPGESGA